MTDVQDLPRTAGTGHVFDKVHAWLDGESKLFVRVEGMGNVRTLVFFLDTLDKVQEGEPVDPTIEQEMFKAESELKRLQQDIHLHKILLGKSIKSLEEKKDRVEQYCEKKKEVVNDLMAKSIEIHSRKFLNSCTTFSKALLEFLEKR